MIWNFSIKRPVLTIVVFLVIGIFGFYGYQQLAVREFPDVEFPVVNVNVVLPGAEPQVIETEILEPLEEEINTTEGIKKLTSTAREEVGTITAEFELWRNIDIAAQDVRDRVNRAQRALPQDAEAPIIRKLDPDAQAILWLSVRGNDRWSLTELTEYADNNIIPRLESIRGVGRVQIGGERKLAVRIMLDHQKLAAHRLTVRDVVNTIRANNVDIPSGRIEGKQREFLVRVQGQFSSAEPFNDLVIAHRNGSPIRLADVGKAVEGVENERTIARFNGEPTIGLGVVKQSDANMVKLADTVRSRIEEISKQFPPGVEYSLSTDDSVYVSENINDLQMTIVIATLLVVVVILFFLGTFWATLISSIAIPTSLFAGMAMVYTFNFSLNVLTMLAFILVIGIVVDDAIVVLESCYRHLEMGAEREAAARVGTTEIAFAAIANSLSLAAVFIPVAFTRGIIGRFFFEFGVTVAVTVFASTFTALTLTPMLCSRFLSVPENNGSKEGWTDKILDGLENAYETVLDWSLDHRFIVVILALLTFGAGIFYFQQIPKEFAPDVDRGEFMISFETPEGSTLSETNDYARKIERTLEKVPEVDRYFLAIGLSQGAGPGKVNTGISFVRLPHRTKRKRSQEEVMQAVRERLSKIPAGQAFVLQPGGPGGGNNAPIQVVLKNQDLNRLAEQKDKIVQWMRRQKEFVGVNSNLKLNKPQVNVTVNRDKIAEMGLSVADISNTLRYILGEPEITQIERGNERYQVIPELQAESRAVPSIINELYMRSDSGDLVSMANLVNLEEIAGPSEIHHYNRGRSVTISASTPQGVVMGTALNKLRDHLKGSLPASFSWETTGEAQDMQESFYYLTISLVFAVIFVYLVLAAQFESWLHPFTIMLTLPLAASGAYGALYYLGMTFSVFTFIGTIMLIGLVTKNGILLVDYANIYVARGNNVESAAREAGLVRFRPVLMTAFSTILGMMPIALGYGAGGEARAPMGWSVAAGMFTATALTLIVIPVVYTLFDDLTNWLQQRPFGALRLLFHTVIVGAGGWIAYLAYTLSLTGPVFWILLGGGALLAVLAVLTMLSNPKSPWALFFFGILLLASGLSLVAWPTVFESYLKGFDLVRSGTVLGVLGFLSLALMVLPKLREQREDES